MLIFTGLLLLSTLGFVALWFNATKAHSGWLLLVMGSRDGLASLQGGNVELMLLFFMLLAARLLWDQRGILAAPLIALVLLIKPFYALFFVALLVLQGVSPVAGIDKAFLRRWLRWLEATGPEGFGPIAELKASSDVASEIAFLAMELK